MQLSALFRARMQINNIHLSARFRAQNAKSEYAIVSKI